MQKKTSNPSHRSAKTGLYVTEKFATKHPATTMKVSNPVPGRGVTEPSKGGGKK